MWGMIFGMHPGMEYLVLAVAVIIAIGGAVHGKGWRRLIAPAIVAAGGATAFLMPSYETSRTQDALASFDAACREAGGEVRRTVQGVNEVFVEHDPGEPGNVGMHLGFSIPHVDRGISSPLLREHPRFTQIAVHFTTHTKDGVQGRYVYVRGLHAQPDHYGKPVEVLPRHGLRWRRDPSREAGIEPYRLEIFDRTTGEVLGMQKNFKLRTGEGTVRVCPITDPADFVRSVLVASGVSP